MSESSQQDDKSRSQIKREFRALKDLGIALADLSRGQLRAVPLSPRTLAAVLAAKTMDRKAAQRHFRHLSSLLAQEENVAAIQAAMSGQLQPHADEVAALHQAEDWRDRLLSADESQVAACVEQFPGCDRTHLRQLVRNAKKERELGKPPKSARQLFRYLRQITDSPQHAPGTEEP